MLCTYTHTLSRAGLFQPAVRTIVEHRTGVPYTHTSLPLATARYTLALPKCIGRDGVRTHYYIRSHPIEKDQYMRFEVDKEGEA